MSSGPKDSGKAHVVDSAQVQRRLALAAGIAGLAVVAVIIIYALLHANRAVPGAAVATSAPDMPQPLSVGTRAPSFELHSNIGTFSSSTLAGTPYLLEIFATWCPHCQRMTAVLRELRSRVPEDKLAMLSVTGSPYAASSTPDNLVTENQEDVDAFDSKFGITWPSLLDSDLTVARAFGLNGFPTIFVINAHGTITYTSSGEVPLATLLDAVRRAGA